MKKLLIIYLMAIAIQSQAQNVGIGNPTPNEKLDVTGNINVTGTIKANGVDGTANQVLMKNNSGILTWGDACDYKNFKVYEFTTSSAVQTFTVPSGVTKVKVQLWGGGGLGITQYSGAAKSGAGGGGGGYLEAVVGVTPGLAFNILVAEGATEANMLVDGTNSIIGIPTLGYSIYAFGGSGAAGIASALTAGLGGGYNFPATLTTAIGVNGETGHSNKLNYQYLGTATLGEEVIFGNGGNAGNTTNTGGIGRYYYSVGGVIRIDTYGGGKGKVPGGGGSATTISGANDENEGANGRIIIYW